MKKRRSGSDLLATLFMCDLTGLEVEPFASHTESEVINATPTSGLLNKKYAAASDALNIKLLFYNNRVIAHKI